MSWILFGCVILAAVANIAGGFVIFIKKDWSDRSVYALMAISAGLLLSISIADVFPEVIKESSASPIYILASLAAIFLLQQWLEPHSHAHEQSSHPNRKGQPQNAVTSLTVGMTIHTFFDGFSIVASFALNVKLGIAVLIAIFLHKISDGVTISSVVFSLSRDKGKAVGAAIIMGISTIAGGIAAWLFTGAGSANGTMLAIALSISAGIFLYIANVELLPAVHQAKDKTLAWFFVAGIAGYFLINWILDLMVPGLH